MKTEILISSRKADAKYDLIKFLLSLLVLAIHADVYPMVLYPWLRIAVPLFFMMSSCFVFSKLRDADAAEQKAILKKFVIRNVQLYVCWFLILLPITLIAQKQTYFSHGFLANIVIFVRSVFFSNTFFASWYIPATVFGVLIIHFLSKLLKKDFWVFLISLLSFCVVCLASSYKSNLEGTVITTVINLYVKVFGEIVLSFPSAILWVFMGKLFAEQKIQWKRLWLLICLIVISCVGLFAEWKWVISLNGSYDNDNYFMLAPVCILLFIGIQRIKPIYWKPSVYFKNASTIIYVSHGSIVFLIAKYLGDTFNINIPLLNYGLTFLCCILIYFLITLIPQICHNQRIRKLFKMLY